MLQNTARCTTTEIRVRRDGASSLNTANKAQMANRIALNAKGHNTPDESGAGESSRNRQKFFGSSLFVCTVGRSPSLVRFVNNDEIPAAS